jgi:hypothetical protein
VVNFGHPLMNPGQKLLGAGPTADQTARQADFKSRLINSYTCNFVVNFGYPLMNPRQKLLGAGQMADQTAQAYATDFNIPACG